MTEVTGVMEPFYAFYEERRQYPRVVVETPVQVSSDEVRSILVTAHDISPDGLQIRCDRITASALHPSGRPVKEEDPPRIDIVLHLPFPDGPRQLRAVCELSYIAVCPNREIAFGVTFRELKPSAAATLTSFLEESLIPADVA